MWIYHLQDGYFHLHPKLNLPLIFLISANGTCIHPVDQAKNVEVICNSHFPYSLCPIPSKTYHHYVQIYLKSDPFTFIRLRETSPWLSCFHSCFCAIRSPHSSQLLLLFFFFVISSMDCSEGESKLLTTAYKSLYDLALPPCIIHLLFHNKLSQNLVA